MAVRKNPNSTRQGGFLSQVQETEISIIRQKSSASVCYTASQDKRKEIEYTEIETPKRVTRLMSPGALVQIGASPHSKRYSSIRKIDFGSSGSKKTHSSARKLSFLK